jgi:hypothetical protein
MYPLAEDTNKKSVESPSSPFVPVPFNALEQKIHKSQNSGKREENKSSLTAVIATAFKQHFETFATQDLRAFVALMKTKTEMTHINYLNQEYNEYLEKVKKLISCFEKNNLDCLRTSFILDLEFYEVETDRVNHEEWDRMMLALCCYLRERPFLVKQHPNIYAILVKAMEKDHDQMVERETFERGKFYLAEICHDLKYTDTHGPKGRGSAPFSENANPTCRQARVSGYLTADYFDRLLSEHSRRSRL